MHGTLNSRVSYYRLVSSSPRLTAHSSSIVKKSDSSLAVAVAMAPFDSRFDPRQRRHLIRAQLVSQLIRV